MRQEGWNNGKKYCRKNKEENWSVYADLHRTADRSSVWSCDPLLDSFQLYQRYRHRRRGSLCGWTGIHPFDADAGCTSGILLSDLRKYGHRRYQDSWKSWCKNHRILSGNHSPGCMRGSGKCSADQSGPGS